MTARVRISRDLSAATELVNRRYGFEHPIPAGEGYTTFVVEDEGRLLGTITLAVTGSSAELIRFAFEEDVRSTEILAMLFNQVFLYGTSISDCTDLFIRVRPKHTGFYRLALGFEPCGEPRYDPVMDRVGQLLTLPVSRIAEMIHHPPARSLYVHFHHGSEDSEVALSGALDRESHEPLELGASRPAKAAGAIF